MIRSLFESLSVMICLRACVCMCILIKVCIYVFREPGDRIANVLNVLFTLLKRVI